MLDNASYSWHVKPKCVKYVGSDHIKVCKKTAKTQVAQKIRQLWSWGFRFKENPPNRPKPRPTTLLPESHSYGASKEMKNWGYNFNKANNSLRLVLCAVTWSTGKCSNKHWKNWKSRLPEGRKPLHKQKSFTNCIIPNWLSKRNYRSWSKQHDEPLHRQRLAIPVWNICIPWLVVDTTSSKCHVHRGLNRK